MRQSNLRSLAQAANDSGQDVEPVTERQIARKATVLAFGPRTAAWLINKHRKELHKTGTVDFVVPKAPKAKIAEKLRWFFIAMDYLRTSRSGWLVTIHTQNDNRVFRVRWTSWQTWKREA
jgi:hypothetical protein